MRSSFHLVVVVVCRCSLLAVSSRLAVACIPVNLSFSQQHCYYYLARNPPFIVFHFPVLSFSPNDETSAKFFWRNRHENAVAWERVWQTPVLPISDGVGQTSFDW